MSTSIENLKQAVYHPEEGRRVVFDILSTNANGTVNLGYMGELVVGSCIITETPEIGSCTLLEDGKA